MNYKAWLGEKQRVTTRITPQLKNWLEKHCKDEGISMSEFVRRLVIEERRRHAIAWDRDYHRKHPQPPAVEGP
jgi:hypothetical protein